MVFVGAYWSARKETREEAARRVAEFLQAISAYKSFSAWFIKAKTKAEAGVPVELTKESLASYFRTNNREDNGEPIPQLGFSLGIWNGAHASLRFTLGAFSSHISNAIVLSFGPEAGEIERTTLEGALNAAIRAFDPDNAVVTSHERMDRTGAKKPWEAGILTYERGGVVKAQGGEPIGKYESLLVTNE
jgi:hypothetical protein